MWRIPWRLVLGFLGAGLVVAAQIPPDVASSNLAAWAQLFGLDRIPQWMGSARVDDYATWVGTIMAVAALAASILARYAGRNQRALAAEKSARAQRLEVRAELEACWKRGQEMLSATGIVFPEDVVAWRDETAKVVAKTGDDERFMFETAASGLSNKMLLNAAPQLERHLAKLRLIIGRAYRDAD